MNLIIILVNIVVNITGFFVHGEMGAYNILLCSVNIVPATYQYTNGCFHTLTKTPAETKHIPYLHHLCVSYAHFCIHWHCLAYCKC